MAGEIERRRYAALYGPTTSDRIRLADTEVFIEVTDDRCGRRLRWRCGRRPGSVLRWLVEPAVATRGCRHRSTATIRLATGAVLVWREELVAGRAGESPGRFDMRLDVEREDRPLLRQELHIGPGAAGWASPAVLGASKASGMVVVVDPAAGPVAGAPVGDHAAVLPLASGGAMVSATASGVVALRRALDEGMAHLGV